jgi:hypothetical protein
VCGRWAALSGRRSVVRWNDLVRFIRSEYEVVRLQPDEVRIKVRFYTDVEQEERAQIAIIARSSIDELGEWVQIASPFAKVADVDVFQVLSEIGGSTVVGGAVVMGEFLVLRHSMPLETLDANEFLDPLELIAGSAERLEEIFTGRDDF